MSCSIESERLLLAPVTLEHVRAFFQSRAALGELLGAVVPGDWLVCPESMEYLREKESELQEAKGWAGYLFIHKGDRTVIGDGGFKSPPDTSGKVEAGYAIIPAHRRQGFATKALKALLDWAFGHPAVTAVTAKTLPRAQESMRVLEKLGTAYQGLVTNPREGAVYLWELSREDYEKPPAPSENEGCPNS